MRIAILGAGRIGGTIARRLGAAGHAVALANSRGPETLRELAAETGATAARADEAVDEAQVVITSVPFPRLPALRDVVVRAPHDAIIVDTSNYFPFKDGPIPAVEKGQVESVWVQEQLGRAVTKAWNNILAGSFADKASAPGTVGRIALAVAGDDAAAKATGMTLVDTTGFDAVDAGLIADSWRQQPGTPAYCTELSADELRRALAGADRGAMVTRRDAMVAEMRRHPEIPDNDELLRLSRKHYLQQQ